MNEEKKVVSIGYNGMPLGFIDDNTNWKKEEEGGLPSKDPIGNSGFVASIFPPLRFSNGKTDRDKNFPRKYKPCIEFLLRKK